MTYTTPITSATEARAFFHSLNKAEKLFHPDDAPDSIIDPDGAPIFTADECALVSQRIAEIRTFMPDPCEYIIDTFF